MRKLTGESGAANDDDATYSTDELSSMVERLSEAELARVALGARIYGARSGLEADDLKQQAFCLVFAGNRHCKRGVPIVAFLWTIMKGIAGDENRARRAGLRPQTFGDLPEGNDPMWHAPQPSPEHAVISKLTDGPILAEIEAMVSGDDQMALLLEGIMDEMRGVELENLLGVDAKGLAAVRKRLIRALHAKYPERKAS